MNVYADAAESDHARRNALYQGSIFAYSSSPAAAELPPQH